MKLVGIISGIILLVIVIGLSMFQIKAKNTDITQQKTKVAMIMNGVINDHSWSQSHYEGLEKSARELNLEIDYRQNTLENDYADSVFESAIKDGAEIIIANSFGFGSAELKVAAKHPELHFFHATGIKEAENLSTFFGRIYQMRYLSGIVAGLQTKTNKIGYIAAFDISEVNRGINAFTLGVKRVNPEATVYVNWCNSWVNEEAATNSTNALIEKYGIDVLTVHTDALSPFKIAEEKGVWIIGYNIDNSELYPNRFLTAPIWKWEKFYTPRIKEVLQHKFKSNHYWLGAESGIVDLAPLTEHVNPKAKEIINSETERLKNGTFDVFYGPILDNKGNIKIEDGESMTDEAMLNAFDWYVQGVVLDE